MVVEQWWLGQYAVSLYPNLGMSAMDSREWHSILANQFDAFEDRDRAFENQLYDSNQFNQNFSVASDVDAQAGMGSISTTHPIVQQQYYPLHTTVTHSPEPFEDTFSNIAMVSPRGLDGSNVAGLNEWPNIYQENW
ncbi:hypothetical protein K439DRAFT_730434 [Ramaria rubella]|nr:hypothetical protein K439DRAFT_730434 [Ramaria rubella]